MTATWNFGHVTVRRVVESVSNVPVTRLFPTSNMEDLAKAREWLFPDFLTADDELIVGIQSLLVESEGKRIVVDTCMGNVVPPQFAGAEIPGTGYLEALAEEGFERASVDIVVNTHLHVDHVGWNTMKVGDTVAPTFPNARYVFADEAVAAWEEQVAFEVQSHGSRHNIQVPIDEGIVDRVPLDHHLTNEVWFEAAPGHTRGHVALHISSAGAEALITGDLTHHPVQWAHPDWAQFSDVDPVLSTATREDIFGKYADTGVIIVGTHYPGPTAGRLIRSNGTGRFVRL